jgi:4-hydroxybutyrate---CoA ligase (ADP-forming)
MSLEHIICPSSVAVFGASNKEGSVGKAVTINIISGEFTGKIFPINPSSNTVLGLKCYKTIFDIESHVDLAVIVTPSSTIPQIMEDCGKKGVNGAIIISAGFKETGIQGKQLEEKVREISKRHNMRVIGPNCIGYINTNPSVSLNASFTKRMPHPGNIALISQSGAICAAMLEYCEARNMGFSKIFSLGNKSDVNENDLLAMLANDADTKVILMYIEDLANGRDFIEIASKLTGGDLRSQSNNKEKRKLERTARRKTDGKPILALKVGESTIGSKSIASHTGALAGSRETYNAIFAQSGVIRVDTLEELFDYAVAFAYQPIPSYDNHDEENQLVEETVVEGVYTSSDNKKTLHNLDSLHNKGTPGTVVISNAGGAAAIVADIAERYGLKMADLSEQTIEELKSILPKTSTSVINPVDIIGDSDHQRYEKALRTTLKDPNVNSCIIVCVPTLMLNIGSLVDVIIKTNKEFKEKTLLSCIMEVPKIGKDNNDPEDMLQRLDENKIPQYAFPESSARSMHIMQKYWSWVIRPRTTVRIFEDVRKDQVRELFTNVKKQRQENQNSFNLPSLLSNNSKNDSSTRNYYYISGEQAICVVQAYGFRVPVTKFASNEDECLRFSNEVGYPVALKISSPQIVHKTDVGGVELNLRSSDEVKDAFKRIMRSVRQQSDNNTVQVNGVIIQEFITNGKETIIGMKRDPQFGPLIMFGLGGIYVQVFKDVSFRLAPINQLSALHMIESTKASQLLYGVRGEMPSDILSIVESLERLSQLVIDFPEIQEIDVNPLLVFEKGNGCRAIDVRMVIS